MVANLIVVLFVLSSISDAASTVDTSKCVPPSNSVSVLWKYGAEPEQIRACTAKHDTISPWVMLNSYRSGGQQGVHWRYVVGDDVTGCLKGWTYHDKTGTNAFGKVVGYTTTLADANKRPWCGLPVYRSGGKRGFQWGYCNCSGDPFFDRSAAE